VLSVQEVTWIRAVLHYYLLELTRDKPATLLIDNKSAIDLGHNPVHHQRSSTTGGYETRLLQPDGTI
jgi:hypothetical protein